MAKTCGAAADIWRRRMVSVRRERGGNIDKRRRMVNIVNEMGQANFGVIVQQFSAGAMRDPHEGQGLSPIKVRRSSRRAILRVSYSVMPGLVPGIHVPPNMPNDVDGPDKPGHDDVGANERKMPIFKAKAWHRGGTRRPTESRLRPCHASHALASEAASGRKLRLRASIGMQALSAAGRPGSRSVAISGIGLFCPLAPIKLMQSHEIVRRHP